MARQIWVSHDTWLRDNRKSTHKQPAQDSVIEQITRLIPIANELKLYDAADHLQTLVDNQKKRESENNG